MESYIESGFSFPPILYGLRRHHQILGKYLLPNESPKNNTTISDIYTFSLSLSVSVLEGLAHQQFSIQSDDTCISTRKINNY